MKTWFLLLASFLALTFHAYCAEESDGDFRVIQVLKEGVLVGGNYKDPATGVYQVIKPMAMLAGVKDKVEGDAFTADIKLSGSFTFTDTAGASRTIRKFELVRITR